MPELIFLVYMVSHINDPTRMFGPEVSDRMFESKEECANFVNTIARDDVVIDDKFKFSASDGVIFTGGCMSEFEFELYKEIQDATNKIKGK